MPNLVSAGLFLVSSTSGGQVNKASRSRGEERRKQILQATLRVIAHEGIRAVRHRAVAKEAGASLSATTYYFTDLQDLLCAACEYWADHAMVSGPADMSVHAQKLMASIDHNELHKIEMRTYLSQQLTQILTDHIVEQVTLLRSDRILELAFRHGAMVNPVLRKTVNRQNQVSLQRLEDFCRVLQTQDPAADARILVSVIYQSEQEGLLRDEADIQAEMFRPVYARVMQGLFNLG